MGAAKVIPSEVENDDKIPPPDAADSKWPMFPLRDELSMAIASGKLPMAAPTSMGSPRAVPVPWASNGIVNPIGLSDDYTD